MLGIDQEYLSKNVDAHFGDRVAEKESENEFFVKIFVGFDVVQEEEVGLEDGNHFGEGIFLVLGQVDVFVVKDGC